MSRRKMKNPLLKRVPRELLGDWKTYLTVGLFLILVIGFVSGMYVANASMMTSAEKGKTKYLLEDGHFELDEKADSELLAAIETGKKADVKNYYLDKAKKELDERFPEEFKKKFDETFDSEFAAQFETEYIEQIKKSLTAQGLGEEAVSVLLESALSQAKESGAYEKAYEKAYDSAYQTAYDEAYSEAYEEAWKGVRDEVEEEYGKAEEKYELNDPDFQAVPVYVYENFFRNETEDNNNDGASDGTVRVYAKTEDINLACLMDGRLPETENEIAFDRIHADNAGVQVGDIVTVGGKTWTVTGLIAYVNYSTLHEKTTDMLFDALKFNVAMVTADGFGQLKAPVHYAYAWRYEMAPADEKEEKALSDDFLKALLTQALANDRKVSDYVPRYANPAINFATEDMGSDEAIGGVLLDILIVILAFIFAVTISNTITRESPTIGALRASGYTRGELVRHYLAMPVIVTFLAAAIGNLLGYTAFKYLVVSMYYNSYSLPAYETLWNPEAFLKTTLIPLALMLAVNFAIITKMLFHTPLQFLRQDLKKNRRKKAVRLPKWRFFSRFRLRIVFQNLPNFLVLFCGVLFIMVLLAMAVGMPSTLSYYQENAPDMMFSKYQYVLNSWADEDGNAVDPGSMNAELFGMRSLQRKAEGLDEEISVYGIVPDSAYIQIKGLDSLADGEIYISRPFQDKYQITVGDTITLDEKYETTQYRFRVAGIYEKCPSMAAFLPIDRFRTVFDLEKEEFSGFLSDTELTGLNEDYVATVITQRDITKMCDQLNHSMGAYMQYFQVLCILLSAALIFLLTKAIIAKNETSISMTKILGYNNWEIARLYLLSTTLVMILADAVSVILGSLVMKEAWRAIMMDYSGWFTFTIEPLGYVKMFSFVLLGYLIVLWLDFRRIKKIPLEAALKNVE